MSDEFRCGHVAILGQPNVGKSTLLNHILGQKISITSRKPQTTRQQILGIKTAEDHQTIYVDTPGLHQKNVNALNRYMNRAATSTINSVDVIVFTVIAGKWDEQDDWILNKLTSTSATLILAINKIDKLDEKKELLPLIAQYQKKANFAAIVPICAKHTDDANELEKTIAKFLPIKPAEYPEDQITDKSVRFLVAELVREKIMRQTGEEIPYAIAIEIEEFEETEKLARIGVVIIVNRDSQKSILIGKNGERLKDIGTQARLDIQKMLDKKVFLRLWVKVREGWADDVRALNSLGYDH